MLHIPVTSLFHHPELLRGGAEPPLGSLRWSVLGGVSCQFARASLFLGNTDLSKGLSAQGGQEGKKKKGGQEGWGSLRK